MEPKHSIENDLRSATGHNVKHVPPWTKPRPNRILRVKSPAAVGTRRRRRGMEYPETRTESEGWGDRASHATYHLPGRPMHLNVSDGRGR